VLEKAHPEGRWRLKLTANANANASVSCSGEASESVTGCGCLVRTTRDEYELPSAALTVQRSPPSLEGLPGPELVVSMQCLYSLKSSISNAGTRAPDYWH
jgi:hypothetical protein